MTKERQLWNKAISILEREGEIAGNLHLIEFDDDEFSYEIKIYHGDGYCIVLEKQTHCDPEEIEDYLIFGLQEDGCTYHFREPYDGFKTMGIDKALEELSKYD